MTFNNPIVGGTTLIRPAIHSPDYVAGSQGWTINKDGTAEFNDVTVRGTLESNNYVAGVSGWKLDQSGTADINSLTARGTLQSSNYVAGSTGWKVDTSGSAEFNNITVRSTGTATPISVGASTSNQVLISTNANVGLIKLPTNRPVESTPARIQAGSLNIGQANEAETLQLFGPTVTGANAQSSIFLNSQNNDGSSSPNLSLNTGSSTVTVDPGLVSLNGNRLQVAPTASASDAMTVRASAGQTGSLLSLKLDGIAKFAVDTSGSVSTVFKASNRITGRATITVTSVNTATSTVITFPTALTGSSFTCLVTANTGFPERIAVGYTALSSSGVTLWATATVAASYVVSYTVEGF